MIEAKIEGFRIKYGTDGLFIEVYWAKLLREEFASSHVHLSASGGKLETPKAPQPNSNE